MIKHAIIDFSAFTDGGRLIIKELTILDVDSECLQHWVFKAPVDADKSSSSADCRFNRWMSKHYHGLSMRMGSTEYDELYKALTYISNNVQCLFAATTEKARKLEEVLRGDRSVVSLELLGCPPLPRDMLLLPDTARMQCLLHRMYAPNFYCTMENCHFLAEWCRDHKQLLDMSQSENRVKTFRDWKIKSPSPKELADQGFIQCAAAGDCVKCVYCNVVLFRWEEGDNVVTDHEFNSPFCKYIEYLRQRKEEETKARRAECCTFQFPGIAEEEEEEDLPCPDLPPIHAPDFTSKDLQDSCRP